MIVEYIRYEVSDGEALVRAYEAARAALDASAHCLSYELSRCVEAPEHFILRIEWDSSDGHLRGFRQSPEFASFLAAVRPFIPSISEMRHYEPTEVRRRDRG
ncbi:MAG: antibiotic biosynthesis monooxygenase [Myxococcales bacterium]|nr:MAG: antibiotic biosynthesis monooxygenase [Myxococcales bacterium]